MGNAFNLADTEFSVYSGGIYETTPIQTANLGSFLELTSAPTADLVSLLADIKNAAAIQDEAAKEKLKKKLPYFTPAVIGTYRNKDSIVRFTGLMPLDFDSKNVPAPRLLKHELFERPYIIAAWLSSSQKGVHALAYIPTVESIKQYKALYWGLHNELKIDDVAMQVCVQPFYYSSDPAILIRHEGVKQWTKTGINKKAFEYTPPVKYRPIQSTSADVQRIEKICQTAIDKITDNGHPQLVRIAAALGGYVGAGYLSQTDANGMICGMIRANGYLSQKPRTYERTASEMIQKGATKPIYLP